MKILLMQYKLQAQQVFYFINILNFIGEPKIVHVPYSAILPNIDDFMFFLIS
jgi:hypothetical protein